MFFDLLLQQNKIVFTTIMISINYLHVTSIQFEPKRKYGSS